MDLIDKQELLTELDRYIDAHQGHGFENVRVILRGLKREIIDFPCAQPQLEIIRCKDCKYRYIDEKFGPSCELDTGDPYATGRNADEDNWFCADAERRTDGSD